MFLQGNCTQGNANISAGGIGTGVIGNLYFGYSISTPGNLQAAINGITVINLTNVGGSGTIFIPSVAGQTLATWSMLGSFFLPVSDARMYLSEIPFGNGSSQSSPLPPSGGSSGNWVFTNVLTGLWGDPPFVSGYEYTGTGGTQFTQITLPTGFSSPFVVSYGPGFANTTGPINGGSAVDFLALGGAVGAFRVRGINPSVDAANAFAFPLQVFFQNSTGSYSMTAIDPVPEPGTAALALGALAIVALFGQRKVRPLK